MDATALQGRVWDTKSRGRSADRGNGHWPRGRGRGRSVSASEIRKVREQYRNAKTVRQLGRLKKGFALSSTMQPQSHLGCSDGDIKEVDTEAPYATATEPVVQGGGQVREEGGESKCGMKEKTRRGEIASEEGLRVSKKNNEERFKQQDMKVRKRKGEVEKLRKVTRKGQPVMKHRLSLLLEKLEKSSC